jgi:NAD(P)-dependent dehydrogenase (short-subunit alcohol dehydrogenase family)
MLVAGGAGGIGAATSTRLAEEGASVVVADVDGADAEGVVQRIRDGGGTATAVQFDISDEASVVAMFDATIDAYDGLDGVHVNAADLTGNAGRDDNLVDIDLAMYDHTLAVNLRGHLLVARHAVPHLLQRGSGAMVFTSSGAAFTGGPERAAYAVSKAGVNSLVRHVASRWGKEGIRANGVAPGLVLTGRARSGFSDAALDQFVAQTRSTRLGTGDDIAALVAFLLSDDGSWINGQIISIDGGVLLR